MEQNDWDDDETEAYQAALEAHDHERRAHEFSSTLAVCVALGSYGLLAAALWFLFGADRMRVGPAMLCVLGFVIALAWGSANRPGPAGPQPPRSSPLGNARFASGRMLNAARATLSCVLDGTGIFLGYWLGMPLLYKGQNSLITVGAPGSGKFATLIASLLLSWRGGSMVMNDPKGEGAAVTGRWRALFSRLVVLNPFNLCPDIRHMRGMRWNPLLELNPSLDSFADDCEAIAHALILRGGSSDPHWLDAAQKLIAGLIAFVRTHPSETPTLPRVVEILHLSTEFFIATMMEVAESPLPICQDAAAPWLSESAATNKELSSIRSSAQTQLGSLRRSKALAYLLSGSDFKFSDIKRLKMSVYICLPEHLAKMHARFTRLVYSAAIQASMRLPYAPVLFVMDELATSLGDEQLEAVTTAFALGRGYGVRLHVFFQSDAQREALFGKKANAIAASAGVIQYFQAADETTFRLMSERAGNRTVWYESTSSSSGHSTSQNGQGGGQGSTSSNTGTSTSEHATAQPLVDRKLAYEGLGKPSAENDWHARQLLFVEGLASPVLADRFAYWVDGNLPGEPDPNPYAARQESA
jgi:type IV secretion system protein VirD4